MTDYSGFKVINAIGPAYGSNVSATHYKGLAFDDFDGGSPSLIQSRSGSHIDTPNRSVIDSAGVILQSVSERIYNTVNPIPSFLNVGSVLVDTQYGFNLFNLFLHISSVEIQSIVSTDNSVTLAGPGVGETIDRLSDEGYTLTIPGDGDDKIEFTITWVFTNGASTSLNVTGVRTSIQTALPEYPMTEVLEFKTNITPTYSSESRGSIRQHPRAMATYNWLLQGSELSRFFSTVRAGEQDHFSFPIWGEALTVPTAGAGETIIPHGTNTWDVQVNQSLFIHDIYGSDEIVTVISKTDTSTTVSAFSQSHVKGYSVMPMITGFLRSSANFIRQENDTARVSLTLESATFYKWDIPVITEFTSNGWDELGGDLVWPYPNLIGSGVDVNALTPRMFNDNVSGLVTMMLKTTKVREYFLINHLMRDNLKITELKRFLCYLQGRLKSFYVPSDRADIVVETDDIDTGSTIITADKLNGVDGYAGEVRGIQFQFTDGTVHNAVATFSAGSQDISFTPGLTRAVSVATDLIRVCMLQRVRLDSDDIEIIHTGPTRSIAKLPLVNII